MKATLLTHGTWSAIAAAAFAAGIAVRDTPGDGGDTPPSGETSDPPRSGLSALGGGEGKTTGKGGGAVAGPISSGTATARPATQILEDFLASDDALEQNYLFAQLLLNLDAANAAGLHEKLKEELSGRDGMRQMALFFQAWGKLDGAAAIAAATEDQEEGGRRRGGGRGGFHVMSVLAGWATADGDAATEWLSGVEDPRQKSFYAMGLVNGLAKTDPDGATELVLEMAADGGDAAAGGRRGFGDITSRYVSSIASEQVKRGIDTAVSWAEALPDGNVKTSAFDQVAESYVRSDLEAAKDWVAGYADQEFARRAIDEVARGLAADDPESAIAWADSLPEETRGDVYSETMRTWTRDDALAASEYLATMEPSPARDAAVSSFATSLDREDPESAATWAATIADGPTRTETLTRVARSWMRSDAEAARAWLPSSGLPAETQTQIAENPDRGGGRFDFRRR